MIEPSELMTEVPATTGQWRTVLRRFARHRLALIAVVVLGVMAIACFGASWFAPNSQNKLDLLLGPTRPSHAHWFGTDDLGRDQLSELLYAGRVSLEIGLGVAVLSTLLGTAVGAIAGYTGRWVDQLLMRVTDFFVVLPAIAVLAVAIRRFGNSTFTIALVLSAVGWMYVARIVRGQVLSLKEREFVDAARVSGASHARIIVRHILPNTIGPILVNATLSVAAAIVTESALSFLGFGVRPPATSWGRMLQDARDAVGTDRAYLVWVPGLALVITVLAVNFIADALRDALDPSSDRS